MSLLMWYFKKKLETWGYEDCEISYSLNSCQGDGVAWYGTLGDDNIRRLASRHLTKPPQIGAINRVLDKGVVSISITNISTHYHHFNTMRVDYDWDEDELTAFENEAVRDLFAAIEDDVVDCSKTLEREGYEIVFAQPYVPEMMRRYEHGDAVVEITKHPLEDGGYADLMEPVDQYMLIRDMINGKVVMYDLEVEVTWDGVSETRYMSDVTDMVDGHYWHQLARELLGEIRAENFPKEDAHAQDYEVAA